MKKTFAVILAFVILVSAFVSCDSGETQTEQRTDGGSVETTVTETETVTDETTVEESKTDTEETTAEVTDTEPETESEPETEPPVEPALPEGEPDLKYTSGDGFVMSQFNEMELIDYRAAVKAYEMNKMSVYSEFALGSLYSTVYAGGNGYSSVTYNADKKELYFGNSSDGAILPYKAQLGEKICEVSVTQRHSNEINGMTYIIRLTDGSFIVVDGGYTDEAKTLYETLCSLNGSETNIYIRAWLISHSHGDHYQAFAEFAKTYASKVKLEFLICSPIVGAKNQDNFLNNYLNSYISYFKGTKVIGAHTGMVFDFGCLDLQILLAPEQVYKENAPEDFNESSIVFRIVNEEGSMIFLGDCGAACCDWLVSAYGDALKSDMVQISHHGCETATAELYDKISAQVCFWPCSEGLFSSYRGELVKQHIIEAEYSREHLLHGYGNITRPLSYKAPEVEYHSIFPKSAGSVTAGAYAKNVRIEDGVLKFEAVEVSGKLDPYVHYTIKNVSTNDYNAIRIVVDSESVKTSSIYFTCGNDVSGKFTAGKASGLGPTGASDDGKTTLIAYLADVEGYTGRLSSLRLDFGTENGQTVSIYSVELFKVELDVD